MLGPKTIEMYNKLILWFLDKVVLILAIEFSNTTGCYVIFGLHKFLSLFLYVLSLLFFTFFNEETLYFLIANPKASGPSSVTLQSRAGCPTAPINIIGALT